MTTLPLLEVRDIRKTFAARGGVFGRGKGDVYAVAGVSFSLNKGETLGLVGESGCGKSTLGRLVLNLVEASGGELLFEGQSIRGLSHSSLKQLRRNMQIVFQDPFASLNPKITVGRSIAEPLRAYGIGSRADRKTAAKKLLERVGLNEAAYDLYPHEFSGGQRQRIAIARAIALNPKLLVCDEPVSALDVSIQSQILNLLKDIQAEFGLTYLFISHDLAVIRHMSNRIAVMYLGKIVEIADANTLFENPGHPFTKALISAVPDPRVKHKDRIVLRGAMPSPMNPPSGCRFRTRCPLAFDRCSAEEPELGVVGPGHSVACHLTPITPTRA